MRGGSQDGGWRKDAPLAAIMIVSMALYATGTPSWVFAVAILMTYAFLLNRYSKGSPGFTVWRFAYVTLFACWAGVAIFFGLSALLAGIRDAPPSVMSVALFGGTGLAIGGLIAPRLGRRRGYVPSGRTP